MISLNLYAKALENVNNTADNSLQSLFSHKRAHSCTHILVDVCENQHCLRAVRNVVWFYFKSSYKL